MAKKEKKFYVTRAMLAEILAIAEKVSPEEAARTPRYTSTAYSSEYYMSAIKKELIARNQNPQVRRLQKLYNDLWNFLEFRTGGVRKDICGHITEAQAQRLLHEMQQCILHYMALAVKTLENSGCCR